MKTNIIWLWLKSQCCVVHSKVVDGKQDLCSYPHFMREITILDPYPFLNSPAMDTISS